jgi:hypothetical protein
MIGAMEAIDRIVSTFVKSAINDDFNALAFFGGGVCTGDLRHREAVRYQRTHIDLPVFDQPDCPRICVLHSVYHFDGQVLSPRSRGSECRPVLKRYPDQNHPPAGLDRSNGGFDSFRISCSCKRRSLSREQVLRSGRASALARHEGSTFPHHELELLAYHSLFQ